MAFLAAAAPYIMAAGAAVSAISTIGAGNQAAASANFQADLMDDKASDERGIAQREAIQEKKRSQYLTSRARALAASSGAGAGDETVNRIVGDLDAEGEYRALTALYNGEQVAMGLETGADVTRIEGKQRKRAARMQAASTILSTGASMAQRYG